MSQRHTALRSMHDVGLAAWFGGSLMRAVGLNPAASQASDPADRSRVASTGWARWTPVNAAAIGAHMVGSAGELVTERGRVVAQSGVGSMSAAKGALTLAALAVTGYCRALEKKIERAAGTPVHSVTEPSGETPSDVADAQRRMRAVQWAVPALTGALVVITALAGEQQKPRQVAQGMWGRVTGMLGAGR